MQQPDLFPSIRRKTYKPQAPNYTSEEISFMFVNRNSDVVLYHQMFTRMQSYPRQYSKYMNLYEPGFVGKEDSWIATITGLESFYKKI